MSNPDFHPTLRRQLRRSGLSTDHPSSDALEAFLERVDQSYREADEHRYRSDRAMEVSSAEMQELYDELRATTQQLIESEQNKLHAVISTLDTGVCAVNASGAIVFANAAVRTLLCDEPLSVGHLTGPISTGAENDDGRDLADLIDRARQGERILAVPAQLARPNGEVVDLSCSLVPLVCESGDHATLVALTDVTDHRRALADSANALAEARAAAEAQGRFLATMSHEIRTPLNGIIGMLELMTGLQLNETARRYAEVAQSSAHLLLGIVNEALDFTRIESERFEPEHTLFDPGAALESTFALLNSQADPERVTLRMIVDGELPEPLVGDPRRFRQIITNLVGNALKFTERGEVLVHASAHATEPDKDGTARHLVRVAVSDTGPGIPADHAERVFAPFHQVDGSTTRAKGGAGLGLAISREFARFMGGDITLESTPGVGSTFTLELPFRAAPAHTRNIQEIAPGCRTVIVSEATPLRQSIGEHLAAANADARTLSDPDTAMFILRSGARAGHPVALVVLDGSLRNDGARSLIRAIRDDGSLAAVRILVVADRSAPIARDGAPGEGYDQRVDLPLTRSSFLAGVAAALATERDAPPPDHVASDHPRPRLLVAEDNATNQLVVTSMLERLDMDATVVETGEAALAAAKSDDFDAVLMDCLMPVMDGFEATRAIRALPDERARVPIIAMTANAMPDDRDRCMAAGMDLFLAKPVHLEELADTINAALGARAR